MRLDRDEAMTARIGSGLFLAMWLLVLGAACEKSSVPPHSSVLAGFGSVDSITLESRKRGAESKTVVIEDRARIEALLALTVFEKKRPCLCRHDDSLTFRGSGGEAIATICDDCFDLRKGNSVTPYRITEEFYRAFRELLREAKSAQDR